MPDKKELENNWDQVYNETADWIRTTEHWSDFSQPLIIDAMLTATFEVIFKVAPNEEMAMTLIMSALSNFSDIKES